jgi:hypothetical protein
VPVDTISLYDDKRKRKEGRVRVVELVVSSLVAALVTLPLLSYFLIFILAKKWTKNHRRSVGMAMDLSTFFFIFSVHYLILAIWDKHLFWMTILVILTIACSVVIVHYKVKQEILFQKVLKGFWRLNFICFLFVYFLLCLYGIVARILNVVAV